ncbi:hypothetical protein Tdes44962_MAKER00431, partial [Teratosphaeria destructans]
ARLSVNYHKPIRTWGFTRCLVFCLDFIGVAFVATAAILESGLNLNTLRSCAAAIYLCLVFYFCFKALIQVFLIERIYILRRHSTEKSWHDPVRFASFAFVVCGFTTIAITAFVWPVAGLTEGADGGYTCRIGLPNKVLFPLLAYDIAVNLFLTLIFVALLWPALKYRKSLLVEASQGGSKPPNSPMNAVLSPLPKSQQRASKRTSAHDPSRESGGAWSPHEDYPSTRDISGPGTKQHVNQLRDVLLKCLAASVLVLIPTIVNLALLHSWNGHEQGWLCFTVCTFDVTAQICVVHWVTVEKTEKTPQRRASR